ncbi:hypothetical protein RU639_004671 [Aspergillus parasiticus]
MADETIVLPSIAEIEASADILSDPSRSVKVVRVRERFAVKLGTSIAPLEAENMKFVAANIKVPVPKVHDHFVDPETQKRYIVMDYVPRTDLQKLAPSLPEDQKKTDKGHKTVFTHADLQPKNVMVEQKGVCEDGSPDYQGNPEWLELVPDIFDEYPVEYLMMRVFYASMFY